MRLPPHFRDGYLSDAASAERTSGLPVDLAHHVDKLADSEISGSVIQYLAPKILSDVVGPASCSMIPAALDSLLAPHLGGAASFFVDMFALFVVDRTPQQLPDIDDALRSLLTDAVIDHFEAIRAEHGGPDGDLAAEVRDLIVACDPRTTTYPVRFRFAAAKQPRGARLLDHLFDVRPNSFAPEPWPKFITL